MANIKARAELAALRPVAKESDAVSDALRDELKAIEGELADLRLGVAVVLDECFLVEERDSRTESWRDSEFNECIVTQEYGVMSHHRVAYERHGQEKRWRLVAKRYEKYSGHRRFRRDEEILVETTPLLEVGREVRIAAAEKLGDLLALLRARATKRTAAAREVIS